jgi:hypothetical protein
MRVSLGRMLTATEIRLIRDSVIRRLSVWRRVKMLLRPLRTSG